MDKIMECKKYFQSQIGNTEKIVSVIPKEQIETILDTKNFIKKYKVSRFGNSYFSIKRLIHKIFIKKLHCPIEWNNNFLDETKIILLNCSINIIKNEASINLIKSIETHDSRGLFNNKRIKDINKYKKKIDQGINLGNPLYISGAVLNKIGGSIDPYEIFMIDGARRLIANVLCKQELAKIWLIVLK